MTVTEAIRKRKIPIIVVSVVIGTLFILLVFVPLVFGEQFVSFSFQPKPRYIVGPLGHTMEIVYINGSIIPVSCVELEVNVTNSYFVPVQVKYNGFRFVWLIYNYTVVDPEDVVGNRAFLVWGAFDTPYLKSIWGLYGFDWRGTPLGNMTGYEYYVARKDLSNYTTTIPVGTYRKLVFYWTPEFPASYWYGQDLHGSLVSPGTYYIYCIAYGKVAGPLNLTVTSILWSP